MRLLMLILALLLFGSHAGAQRKKKKTSDVAEKHDQFALYKLVSLPLFFNNDESEKKKQQLLLDYMSLQGFKPSDMSVEMSSLEKTMFNDHLSLWMSNAKQTLDIDYAYNNGVFTAIKDLLDDKSHARFEDAKFITDRFGTYKTTPFVASKDSSDNPRLWYHNDRVYRKTSILVEAEAIGVDDYGNPIYEPEDIDAFGTPITFEKQEYQELELNELNLLENWRIEEDGDIVKEISGLSIALETSEKVGPQWSVPILLPSGADKGKLFMKNVCYSVPFHANPKDYDVMYYGELISLLLHNAKAGKYDMFVNSEWNNRMNLAKFNYQIEKNQIPATDWQKLSGQNDTNSEFLVITRIRDSIPPSIAIDEYGKPVYDPKDMDAYGNVKIYNAREKIKLGFMDIAGIQFLEDWYLNPESGQLTKVVKGFSFISYLWTEGGEVVSGITDNLGEKVFFRIKSSN